MSGNFIPFNFLCKKFIVYEKNLVIGVKYKCERKWLIHNIIRINLLSRYHVFIIYPEISHLKVDKQLKHVLFKHERLMRNWDHIMQFSWHPAVPKWTCINELRSRTHLIVYLYCTTKQGTCLCVSLCLCAFKCIKSRHSMHMTI